MISDILFEWNVLTVTMAVWASCVSLALAADFGPDIYREYKARQFMANITMQKIAERKIKKPITFHPDTVMQLGVFHIQPIPAKRRHARA